MESKRIYEKIMLDYYFNKMKHFRDRWDVKKDRKKYAVETLIDVGGEDHRIYQFIMGECTNIVLEMLEQVIIALIQKYEIPVKYYDLRCDDSDAYYIGEEQHWIDYINQHRERRVLAFSRIDVNPDVLFIFKEYGIGKRIPEKTLKELMEAAHLKKHCYISYVENDAFTEVINHNDDEHDPTRGTGRYSLKQFFEVFFGVEEFVEFKEYAEQFSKKVRDYFGLAVVKTLKPNAIYTFKKTVRDDLKSIDAAEIGATVGITEGQRRIIEKHFIDEKNYELLLGNSDFAQSYMTAEWLYYSLNDAGNIDYTAVAMGYFKAIEQLLFGFLKNHTHENDGSSREVYVGKDKSYANSSGNAPLENTLFHDPEKSKELTLGSLTGFFGYHDTRKNRFYKRNQDLLTNGINEQTYEFIIDTLGGIVGRRNGYFHRDNLKDWKKVAEARKKARLVFYILLGAYNISEDDKARLGLIQVAEHDDYYKLCDYVNHRSFESSQLEFPIIYLDNSSNPNDFVFPHHDDYIEYDNCGEPKYSGVYIRGQDKHISKLDRDHLPKDIWEGTFTISRSIPLTFTASGAQKRIFHDGVFVKDKATV